MGIGGIDSKEYKSPGYLLASRFRVAARAQEEAQQEGDTVSFSQQTLSKLNAQIAQNESMTASAVHTTLDDGNGVLTRIAFNNKNGAITWGGNTLELKGFANALKDDLVIKNGDGVIEVYNLSTNQKLTLNADGTRKYADGKPDESYIQDDFSTAKSLSVGLFINNRGLAANAGDSNDIIINRQADAAINAGGGDDKIFNFAATAERLDGGGGDDSVYSVGLTHGTNINVSNGNGYVKLLGNMTGGSISLGSGENFVDASGRVLAGVKVSDSAQAEASAVVAKTISAGSSINLNAQLTAVDAKLISSASVSFGSGVNSLVADKITGKEGDKSTISSTGTNTYQVGSVTHTKFDSSGAISDAFKITGTVSDAEFALSKGENLLDATGKALKAVKITSAEGGEGGTTIIAASITGRNEKNRSIIDLAGSESGNTVNVSAAVKNAYINTGNGAGTVNAASMNTVELIMGGSASSKNQVLNINGKASNLIYRGSNGNDDLTIMGAVTNSHIELGEGDNSFTAQNAKGVAQSVRNTSIIAGGSGSTTMLMGNYTYDADGNVIALGSGSNSVELGKVSGRGTSGLHIVGGGAEQNITVNGSVNYFNYHGAKGDDTLKIVGSVNNSNIQLGEGENSFTAQNAKGVYQNLSNTNVVSSGQGSTSMAVGNVIYGANGNAIILGGGANSITTGNISGKGETGLLIDVSNAQTQEQNLIINGSAKKLFYIGSDGADSVSISGNMSNSAVALGGGSNSFSAENSKSKVTDTYISASGSGGNTININNFTTAKNGSGGLELGNSSGNDTVSLNSVSGNTSIDMGSGAASSFTALNMNGTKLSGAGGGTYTIHNGQKIQLDFTGSTESLNLNIQSNLVGSLVNLGNGGSYIGSAYAGGSAPSANISGTTINGGNGALQMDVNSISGSSINMSGENAGSSSQLELSVNSVLSGSNITLGEGDSAIRASVVSGSVINRTENGSLTLEGKEVSSSVFNLTGAGSDSLNVSGNLNAALNFDGAGADAINVGGAISGSISSKEDIEITAKKLAQLNATLDGNNTINTNSIEGSKLIMGSGANLIGELPFEDVNGEHQEDAEEDNNYRLNISGSTIQSGSGLDLKAHNVSSSTITMKPEEGAQALLNLDMTGKMSGSTLNLAGGDSVITAATMHNSHVNRTEDGNLLLEAESISGGSIGLDGVGYDRISVSGNMTTTVYMGEGDDVIAVGGNLGGKLNATDNITVQTEKMSGLQATLYGATNVLDVTDSVTNSNLYLGAGSSTVGNAGTSYNNTSISAAFGNNVIKGTAYEGGSIQMGDGDNLIDITDSLSATVTLGSGTNSVGADSTALHGFTFTGTGSNTIRGRDLVGGSVTMGAQDKNNQLLLSGLLEDSSITLEGGTNTVGGRDMSIVNSVIKSGDSGHNTIEASGMNGAVLNMGDSDDHVEVYGDIADSEISLGGGANSIRNTLADGQDAHGVAGQGQALGNQLRNSTVVIDGNTNAYLGNVSGESTIYASGTNNINLAGLTGSAVEGSGMQGGSLSIGTVNGNIAAGLGTNININNMQTGVILDEIGQNSITVGTLGERALIQTGENIHSTTLHINNLDGTLNLLNSNYDGLKRNNLTVANTPYAGTVKIGGNTVSGAGTPAQEVDTSGFGLGEGDPVA